MLSTLRDLAGRVPPVARLRDDRDRWRDLADSRERKIAELKERLGRVRADRDHLKTYIAEVAEVPHQFGAGAEAYTGWRGSKLLGGEDLDTPERAFPGMDSSAVMTEHINRYAFATGFVAGKDVLDLGCGTGYGSEMLSWTARRVRGFDLWKPTPDEQPHWPGPHSLTWGHDLTVDALPSADWAVWFENIEHLEKAQRALRIGWRAVDNMVASFPNPVYHGSQHNHHHVTDWSLDEFEMHVRWASTVRFNDIDVAHFHQFGADGLIQQGANAEADYWIVVAHGLDPKDGVVPEPATDAAQAEPAAADGTVASAIEAPEETPSA
ncbi:hypothetical protein JCM18899A_19460 [Nocardioides sp. AN3]